MVREVVSKVMTSSHGPTLVGTSMGFSEQEIKELEQRRKDERDKLSSQPTSSKILDYTNIVDLKRIIQDNWQEFSPIFLSKDTTMVYLDTLNKFRNPIAHVRPGILEHQYYLALGICGQLSLYIKRWRAGYRHHVKSYFCEFRFSSLDQNDSRAKANNWSEKIESLSSKDVSLSRSNEFGEEKLIRLSKGQVRISSPQTIPQSGVVPYWTTVIQARVSTRLALNDLLTNGNHPCWALLWNLREDINVHTLIPEINFVIYYCLSPPCFLHLVYQSFFDHIFEKLFMFNIIQTTIAHEFGLVKIAIFIKFQQNVFPYENPVPILMDHLSHVL